MPAPVTAWDGVPVWREKIKPDLPETNSEPASSTPVVDGVSDAATALAERPLFTRMYRGVMFGTILGGLCGTAYGFMDSFGTKEGRAPEKFGLCVENMKKNAFMFGGVFAAYQLSKESIRSLRGTDRNDPYDPLNGIGAAVITVLPMTLHPVSRVIFPHVAVLVAVDMVNESGTKLF